MTLTLQRSNGLLLYLVVVHALAVLLLYLLKLNVLITAFGCLLLVLSLLTSCRRYGWLQAEAAICQLRCDGDGRWFLAGSQAPTSAWQLTRGVILGPIMVLSFKIRAQRSRQSVLLTRDALDAESWRQLCLKLRDPETWD